jgi:hypothetical protein
MVTGRESRAADADIMTVFAGTSHSFGSVSSNQVTDHPDGFTTVRKSDDLPFSLHKASISGTFHDPLLAGRRSASGLFR